MNLEKKVNIVVITLIIILVIGIISLVVYQKYKYRSVYFNYNGFDVHKVRRGNVDFYYIKMFLEGSNKPLVISTRNDPRTLENISIEDDFEDIKKAIIKRELYISLDTNTTGLSVISGMEISKITGNSVLYNIPTHGAMISKIEGKNVTVKSCYDADNETGVIWLKLGNKTRIYSKGINKNKCVIIEGSNEYELIRGADRFILTLLGIMKP